MAKKKTKLFCYDCDVASTVSYDEDESFHEPEHCPFCGEVIEEADSGEEGEDDFESESEEDERY